MEIKKLQDKILIHSNHSLYEEFIEQLKKNSSCPLCERNFRNADEEKKLEEKLKSEITVGPQILKNRKKKLETERKRYDSLLQLKPVIMQISKIEVELPNIRYVHYLFL